MGKRNWNIFINSIFFVLGLGLVFSLLGVLLQTVLSNVSYIVQTWLGRIGGVIIILFGLYLLGLIKPKFLMREYKLKVNRKFSSQYLTSFVFGAAFAVGWSPCVGAILGAILTLAVTQPTSAFFLLFAYSLGLGLPFLVVGLFTNQAKVWISKSGRFLQYINYIFGVILIILGIFVFTSQLSRIANFALLTNILLSLNIGGLSNAGTLNVLVAFLAGLGSFLSPCVLPLIPAFLAYLGTTVKDENKDESQSKETDAKGKITNEN